MNKQNDSLVAKNLEWLIAKAKTTPYALQKETKVPQPTIHRILTGESEDPRTSSLQPLADFFGVTVSDLRDRNMAGEADKGYEPNAKQVPLGVVRVPVISAIQAGRLKEITDPYSPGAGFDVEYVDVDDGYSRWTFALEIEGLSMYPEFRERDRVIIDPDISPNPGDYVAARNTKEEATFKKYRPRGMDANGNMIFELVPINPDFPTMRSDIEHLEIIGVMVEHRKKYRRPKKQD